MHMEKEMQGVFQSVYQAEPKRQRQATRQSPVQRAEKDRRKGLVPGIG